MWSSPFMLSPGRGDKPDSTPLFGCDKYNANKAPCICVEGTDHGTGSHGLMHTFQSDRANQCKKGALVNRKGHFIYDKNGKAPKATTVKDAQRSGAEAVNETFPEAKCSKECLEAQLAAYHQEQCGMPPGQPVKAVATTTKPDVTGATQEAQARNAAVLNSMAPPGMSG